LLFVGWLDLDFDVVPECGEKFDESAYGEIARAIAGERGDSWLLHTGDPGGLCLGQAALLDDGVNL
jgi:hypothetical protein